ncbi:hypothetical protein [Kitasatospora purpeofusca]|uniref:hypothetical protein n=1 Tax=Kitasatospora purpeofusca TaxID=67352 RepID=UPI00382CACBA
MLRRTLALALSLTTVVLGTTSGTAAAYTYDLDNRLTRKTVSGATTGPARDNTYGYTARGTLATVTTGPAQEELSYDAFDRLVTDGATACTYDGLDRPGVNTGSTQIPPGMREIQNEGGDPANAHLVPAAAKGPGIDLRNLVAEYWKNNSPYLSTGVEADIVQAIKADGHVALVIESRCRGDNSGVPELVDCKYFILEGKIYKRCIITQAPSGGTKTGTSNCPNYQQ